MKNHIMFDCEVHGLINPKVLSMEKVEKKLIVHITCPICHKVEEKNEIKPESKQTSLDDLWLAAREFKR